MIRLLVFATTLSLASVAANAADGERYRLEKAGDGFVRLDTRTGEMSICQTRDAQLICKLAADERSAFQADVDRLQTSVEGLETRVAKLENSYAARLESSLPSEEDFEKTMTYMERFFRGFAGIVKDLQDEERTPAPDRT